jgi:uncharacterized protein YcbX
MLQISELYVYPIKSLPGIPLQQARVTERGFEHDRRWMLVDENNLFISQRTNPEMTQLLVSIESSGLRVTHKTKNDSIAIPFQTAPAQEQDSAAVTIWDDTCTADFVNNEVDEWFSLMLGMKCRLVYMPENSRRTVDQRYAPEDAITSFADGYPFLIIGQASLDELNNRLSEPLPMNRFRPNIVFTGGAPFGEDMMAHFVVAGVNFYGVKLCARCVMTTINQDDASKGKEPLKTLATYRRKEQKILFGQNLIHDGQGLITVGDSIQTLSFNRDERFIVHEIPEKI